MINKVIFLGAGASRAEGAPVQSSLFRDYFSCLRRYNKKVDSHLNSYFKTFWNIDVEHGNLDNIVFPTFEEALGMLELAKQRREGFRGFYNTANFNGIEHTIEDLILLICQVLKWMLQNNNVYHKKLVDKLINLGCAKETAFISLNYDILIDNAITMCENEVDLDYGIELMNYHFDNDWHAPDTSKSIKLLKLHGSLNWLYCPVCKKIDLTPKVKGVTQLISLGESDKCRLCEGRNIPIIVPPTFFKVMSNPHLVQIWDQAEDLLKTCKEIFFCGYSMPDADIHIKYLIKRGMINRKEEQPSIIIVNNHDGKSGVVKFGLAPKLVILGHVNKWIPFGNTIYSSYLQAG